MNARSDSPDNAEMSVPSREELEKAYEELRDIHRVHLTVHGVRLPEQKSAKWVWLAMLHYYAGRFVHKDLISDAVQSVFPGMGRDQQVRHLKRDGWDLSGTGGNHQLHPYRPSMDFLNRQARGRARISAENFEELKTRFGGKCATCGALEGRPDPRYGRDSVLLQRGHMDPAGPSDDLSNIIPQCQFCNRGYRDDFVFGDDGRAVAVASVRPVSRASDAVKKQIWDYLRRMFR